MVRFPIRRRRSGGLAPLLVAVGLGAGGMALIAGGGGVGGTSYGVAEPAPRATSTSCDIKGNISVKKGERIYHLPGQKYYSDTVINSGQGERWFCSEAEARAAGWRRSKV